MARDGLTQESLLGSESGLPGGRCRVWDCVLTDSLASSHRLITNLGGARRADAGLQLEPESLLGSESGPLDEWSPACAGKGEGLLC